MKKKSIMKSQGGFTLIEIIAVLVILGILAAVAVPRFVGLQDDAREAGLQGAVAAAQSQLSMEYARLILSTGSEETAWTDLSDSAEDVCDQVSLSGWLEDDATLDCSGEGGNTILITAEYTPDGTSVTANFNRPSEIE